MSGIGGIGSSQGPIEPYKPEETGGMSPNSLIQAMGYWGSLLQGVSTSKTLSYFDFKALLTLLDNISVNPSLPESACKEAAEGAQCLEKAFTYNAHTNTYDLHSSAELQKTISELFAIRSDLGS